MNLSSIQTIAFDADDTLWVNEPNFQEAEASFARLLAPYLSETEISTRLYETEKRNLKVFGYGAKGFILSMIETAIELSEERISATEIQRIIQLGRNLMAKPIQILPQVAHVLDSLDEDYQLMLVTKGDLFEQESKIARSGLSKYFHHIEILSEKDPQTYADLLRRYQVEASQFLMIGNSLKSDILPVLEIGGQAIHIPYHTTWVHEVVAETEVAVRKYRELSQIGEILEVIPTPRRHA